MHDERVSRVIKTINARKITQDLVTRRLGSPQDVDSDTYHTFRIDGYTESIDVPDNKPLEGDADIMVQVWRGHLMIKPEFRGKTVIYHVPAYNVCVTTTEQDGGHCVWEIIHVECA